jgi:PEP-CTERM motif
MKTSWTKTFRRLAAGCAVVGSSAFSSAACYAAVAMDNASDPVYADGWQAGDNGGTGFTPWNFDTDAGTTDPGNHYIDSSSPFNQIGTAWALGIPPGGFPRAGRGFSPLQIGETLKVVIDNPTARQFFKGYFVRLSGGTGGVNGNICYGGVPCTLGGTPSQKMRFQTFEYFTYGQWGVDDSAFNNTGVFDTDTAAAGAVFSVKRTGAESYDVLMDPFGPGPSYSASRTFGAGAPVDWIEFTMFNTLTNPNAATDFYIRSMMIVPEPGTAALLLLGAGGTLLGMTRRRKDD